MVHHTKDLDGRAAGSNPIPASMLSPAERRSELCRILAIGLVRMGLRQSSEGSAGPEKSSLDFIADWSGHATRTREGECRP